MSERVVFYRKAGDTGLSLATELEWDQVSTNIFLVFTDLAVCFRATRRRRLCGGNFLAFAYTDLLRSVRLMAFIVASNEH